MIRKITWLWATLMLMATTIVVAQPSMPVHFSVKQQQSSPEVVDVVFTATIDNGWHVYSTNLPDGGPVSATFHDEGSTGAKPQGTLQARGKEKSENDPLFDMKVRFFEQNVTFVQRYKVTDKEYHIKGYLEYGACNDQMCLPPTTVEFDYTGKGPQKADKAEAQPTAAWLRRSNQKKLTPPRMPNNPRLPTNLTTPTKPRHPTL